MTLADVPQVAAIDRASFPLPWSEASFRSDLDRNPAARLIVAAEGERIVGYAGFWLVVDEAHLSTLAVHPEWRRQGLGDRLLREAMRDAAANGAEMMTLEVRPSNRAARRLYEKHGFQEVGRRPRYYKDNLEDAILMTRTRLAGRRTRTLEQVDGR
jgi:ribosomal-protein-alanine N-acetyltransferase